MTAAGHDLAAMSRAMFAAMADLSAAEQAAALSGMLRGLWAGAPLTEVMPVVPTLEGLVADGLARLRRQEAFMAQFSGKPE